MVAAEERKASIFSAALMSEVGSVSQTATQLSCKPKLSSTWKQTFSPRCEMFVLKENVTLEGNKLSSSLIQRQ